MQTTADPSLLVYSEAKTEYTKQLCQFVVPAILKFSINLLEKAKELSKGEQKKILYNFQLLLNEIPDWNNYKAVFLKLDRWDFIDIFKKPRVFVNFKI